MPRTLFHLPSLASGASLVACLFLTIGAAQQAQRLKLFLAGPVEVSGYPTPQQMQRVEQGAPFDVPSGKLYVVTGLAVKNDPGNSSSQTFIRASFNGAEVINAQTRGQLIGTGSVSGVGPSIVVVPPGLVAVGPVQVTVSANIGSGVILGYLVDA